MTLRANPVGFHTDLTPQLADDLVNAIGDVLVLGQAAALCGMHRVKLYQWMEKGEKDISENNQSSIFAQLFIRMYSTKALKAKELIQRLKECPKNYQALTWLLEKCFKDDFGADNEEIKQLREMFKQILPLIGKGDSYNGQDDQRKGNQEDSQKS
jgi:hypothetical protein